MTLSGTVSPNIDLSLQSGTLTINAIATGAISFDSGTLNVSGNSITTGVLTDGNASLLTTASGTSSTFTYRSISGTADGSAIITLPDTDGLVVGQAVTGTGITGTAKILALTGTTVTLDQNVTAGSPAFSFGGVVGAGGQVALMNLSTNTNASWQGNVVLNPSGTLTLDSSTALGNSTLTINGGNIQITTNGNYTQSGATINLNGDFSFRSTWTNSNHTLDLGSSEVNLNQDTTITLNGWGTLAMGNISDGGNGYGLTLQNAPGDTFTSTVTLNAGSAGNHFSGPLTISNGTLLKLHAGALASYTGAVTLTGGAILDLETNGDLNRDVVLNLGAGSILRSEYDATRANVAGLNDVAGAGGTINAGSNGLTLNILGSSNYSFSGTIATGGSGLVKAGTGTQSLSGASTYTGNTNVYSGTLNLDFSAAGAPISNILYAGGVPSTAVLGGATLHLTGSTSDPVTQSFSTISISSGLIGSGRISFTNNGADVAISTGLISRSSGAAGSVNFDLTGITPSATNGVLTTSANDATGILGGWATVTNGANTDWAMVSGGIHAPAAANATVLDIAGTWDHGLISVSTNELDIFVDSTTAASLSVGTLVAFNTVTGGSGITAGKFYYIQSAPTNYGGGQYYFTISATPGGSRIQRLGD